ncbi:uncharacterized protein MYCGRDRAFT_94676 [Zymoseptoria tritici IPO323]|uniref:RING-type domain-containing protein n=1 Tax=Zymoseptoria tritici (strain CBS 115943 / IPO323) TaxID=336722 RepID=F9XGQ4_ZYMTI|nr:uncharacterized protein MYCGRDRAFT_94676 [Zymoseptoria tritici IPO323]EGP85803.1 hypothetical protein MYCGRDRAFT_94676 [Zymoseptoria tritici IPO323]
MSDPHRRNPTELGGHFDSLPEVSGANLPEQLQNTQTTTSTTRRSAFGDYRNDLIGPRSNNAPHRSTMLYAPLTNNSNAVYDTSRQEHTALTRGQLLTSEEMRRSGRPVAPLVRRRDVAASRGQELPDQDAITRELTSTLRSRLPLERPHVLNPLAPLASGGGGRFTYPALRREAAPSPEDQPQSDGAHQPRGDTLYASLNPSNARRVRFGDQSLVVSPDEPVDAPATANLAPQARPVLPDPLASGTEEDLLETNSEDELEEEEEEPYPHGHPLHVCSVPAYKGPRPHYTTFPILSKIPGYVWTGHAETDAALKLQYNRRIEFMFGDCVICRQEFDNGWETICEHITCTSCMLKCHSLRGVCPLCNQEISLDPKGGTFLRKWKAEYGRHGEDPVKLAEIKYEQQKTMILEKDPGARWELWALEAKQERDKLEKQLAAIVPIGGRFPDGTIRRGILGIDRF